MKFALLGFFSYFLINSHFVVSLCQPDFFLIVVNGEGITSYPPHLILVLKPLPPTGATYYYAELGLAIKRWLSAM